MRTQRFLRRVGLVGAVPLAAAGLVGGALLAHASQDTTPSASATALQQTVADDYITRLAQNLGIGEQTLRDAIKKTSLDEIAAAEANGTMTQEQADRARQAVESGKLFFGPGPVGGSHGPRGGDHGPGGKMPGAIHADLATFLGITADALHTEMQSGKTLAEVAQAHGKSRDELKAFLTDSSNKQIDQLQSEGKVTADQATQMKQRFAQGLDAMIDAKPGAGGPKGMPGRGGRPFGPGGPNRTPDGSNGSQGGGSTSGTRMQPGRSMAPGLN